MQVAEGTVVTLAYDITNESGEIIESSDISGPITFIHGRSGLIPGLDKQLLGLEQGTERTFEFPPEEAFGRLEDAPRRTFPRSEFPPDVELSVGAEFEAKLPSGQPIQLRVVEVEDDSLTAAVVHPLAGQRIGMSVSVLAVRSATQAELDSGTVISRPPPPPPPRR